MPTTRLVEKLSTLVKSQLPEFIQSDYETFTLFLKYYYEYLEQDQYAQELIQNARKYSDIDQTASSFVDYFVKQYGEGGKYIPANTLASKEILIKKINDLYQAKGSELSFKTVFRTLFNTTVNLQYPYENVLRASDGTWEQLVSLRITTVSGDASKIENHFLNIVKNSVTYNIPVLKSIRHTSTLTEVFVDPNTPIIIQNTIANGDTVYIKEGTTTVFTGTVGLTTVTATINTGGVGFKVGQVFKVNYEGAVNSLIKVASVSSTGAITGVKFINFGYNYTEPFALSFNPLSTYGSTADSYNTVTGGFYEQVTLLTGSDYFAEDYIDNALYVMTTVGLFTNTYVPPSGPGTFQGVADPDNAVITFTLGTLGRYPGTWTTNRGFLSDNEIRLQDDQLYQPFAYQTETDIDISVFYDIIINTIHPAGQKLFNKRTLNNTINVKANVSVFTTSNVFNEAYDSIRLISDTRPVLESNKSVIETIVTSDNDVLSLTKTLSDTFNIIDSFSQQLQKAEASNNITIADLPPLVQSGTVVPTSEIEPVSDISSKQIGININNNNSIVSFTESISGTSLDFAESGYFAESYAGTPISLV